MSANGIKKPLGEISATDSPISPCSPCSRLSSYHSRFIPRPDLDPTSLALANFIVFPNVSLHTCTDDAHRGSAEAPPALPPPRRARGSSTSSYRPHKLSNMMLKSPNASDHLRRIHVTTAKLCEKKNTRLKFIIFHIIDSALPQVSNILILDRNTRQNIEPKSSDEPQHTAHCWALKLQPINLIWSCLERGALRPGRFYVSHLNEEKEFLTEAGFSDYNEVETLDLSIDQAFSLDNLLVLASSLTSPLRFKHPQALLSPDWYPKSVWEAVQLVSEFIQNEQPLPSPLKVSTGYRDTALLEKVLAKYADNLRKYRNRVIDHQRCQDLIQGVPEKRQREIDAELERNHIEIENQKQMADRLCREGEFLAQQRQELNEELQKLRKKTELEMSQL